MAAGDVSLVSDQGSIFGTASATNHWSVVMAGALMVQRALRTSSATVGAGRHWFRAWHDRTESTG